MTIDRSAKGFYQFDFATRAKMMNDSLTTQLSLFVHTVSLSVGLMAANTCCALCDMVDAAGLFHRGILLPDRSLGILCVQ